MLGGSLFVSIGLQIILPWPFGLIAALAIFLVLPMVIQKKMMKGMMLGSSKLKYACIACSKTHNQRECPRCGSKLKKAIL